MSAARIRVVARLGRPRSPLPPFLLGSLAVHAAFTAALTLVPRRTAGPAFPENAITVSLAAAPPGAAVRSAPPAPARPPETEAAPDKAPEGVTVENAGVRIDKKPKKTKEEAEKKEAPSPGPPSPPPAHEAPAPSGAPTAEVGLAAGGAPSGGASLDALSSEYAWYAASITAALKSQWIRPPLADVREVLSVVVGFEIERDGSVRNLRIEQSSNVPALDRSALRAVTDAAPLPPLPGNLGAASLPARFEFRWYPGEG